MKSIVNVAWFAEFAAGHLPEGRAIAAARGHEEEQEAHQKSRKELLRRLMARRLLDIDTSPDSGGHLDHRTPVRHSGSAEPASTSGVMEGGGTEEWWHVGQGDTLSDASHTNT